jgi:hypothetical protein
LPSRVGIESVPIALLSATVRSALQNSAVPIAGTGAAIVAAPILTLTHGVLTTMKISQLTWIALATLATTLSATGVIAVAFARAQGPGVVTSRELPSETTASVAGGTQSQSTADPTQPTAASVDARLRALENKIDLLLGRSTATTSTGTMSGSSSTTSATSYDPLRPAGGTTSTTTGAANRGRGRTAATSEAIRTPAPGRTDVEWSTNTPATVGSVRELETKLKLEMEAFDRIESLFRRGVISREEREQMRGKVLLVAAVLEGLDDDLSDELDRLRVELKKRTAELHQAEAQMDVATSVIARNRRLNERKPGTIGSEDVAKAEADFRIAEAQIEARKADIEGVSLEASRAQRRRDRIAQAIRLSARATAEVEAVPPAREQRK